MRACGTRRGGLRAITAVIALYALVLQAFLGGLAPVSAAGPAGVLCLHEAGSEPADDDPSLPAHDHHAACCTAAGHAPTAEPPLIVATAIAWPPRLATRVAWFEDGTVRARAPPGSVASARGPPVV